MRDNYASHVLAMAWASVCPFVRPYVCLTLEPYQNGASRITKASPWAVLRTLVFHDKISCPWVKGVYSNEGMKERYPLEKMLFSAAIGSPSVETVADRYRQVAYYINKHWTWAFSFINIDHLE